MRLQAAGYTAMVLFNNATEQQCVPMSGDDQHTLAHITLAAVSLTAEGGALLQSLAASGDVTVALRQPAQPRFDPCALVLLALAVGTIAISAWWVEHCMTRISGPMAEQAQQDERGPPVTEISACMASAFVFVSSGVLLLLFCFLSNWLGLVLALCYAGAAWQGMCAVLEQLLFRLSPHAWQQAMHQQHRGGKPAWVHVAAGSLAFALTATWFVFRYSHWVWPLQNLLSVFLMVMLLSVVQLPNLKVAAILLPSALVYDVWWVFLQPLVTGGPSVMVEVATGAAGQGPLPVGLVVPQLWGLGTNPAMAFLGFGDVVLPGLLVVLMKQWDHMEHVQWQLMCVPPGLHNGSGDEEAGSPTPLGGSAPDKKLQTYFGPALTAYAAGLLLTFAALAFGLFGDEGQPAMLYLVPCTLGTVVVLAWTRGDLADMWKTNPTTLSLPFI